MFLMKESDSLSDSITWTAETISMLQSWLFVGALEHICGRRIEIAEFTVVVDDHLLISTKCLFPLFRGWFKKVRQLDDADKVSLRKEIEAVLREINFWCFKLVVLSDNDTCQTWKSEFGQAIKQWPPLEKPTTSDSISILLTLTGEFISMVAGAVRLDQTLQKLPSAQFIGSYTLKERQRLVHNLVTRGWCPYMARMLMNYCYSVAEFALLSPLRQFRDDGKHDLCSPIRCIGYNVHPGTYKNKHVTDGCPCLPVIPDLKEVTRILDSGGIPVLGLSNDKDLDVKLEVIDATHSQNIDYAAISHVWSDGMGGNTETGLPSCLVKALFSDVYSTQHHYLWIDALCVPRFQATRNKAIRLMAQTYRDASITIVIDRQIAALPFSLEPADMPTVLLALVTTPWMQRLWTLQEALLSQNLSFKFENKIASADDIYKGSNRALRSDVNPSTQSLAYEFVNLLRLRSTVVLTSSSLQLAHIYKMLRFRTSSKPTDETLAVAGLLGIDTLPLHSVDPAERMKVFLRALKSVPRSIIFLDRTRIDEVGYRWAPVSMMPGETDKPATDQFQALERNKDAALAECLAGGGLRGSYKIVKLSNEINIDSESSIIVRINPPLESQVSHAEDNSDRGKYQYVLVRTSSSSPSAQSSLFKFDAIAMDPKTGQGELVQRAAALLQDQNTKSVLGEPRYGYQVRILVKDNGSTINRFERNMRHFDVEGTLQEMTVVIT